VTAINAVPVGSGMSRGGSARKLSLIAWLLIGAVTAADLYAVALGPVAGIQWHEVAALGLLLVACESTATLVCVRGLGWPVSTMASLAAVLLTGPVGAGLVGWCTVFAIRRGPSLAQRLFDTGMFTLSACMAGRAFLLCGGVVGVPAASWFPSIIGPFAIAVMVHAAVGIARARTALWLTGETSSATGQPGLDLRLFLTDLGYGALGGLLAALWVVLGPSAAVLMLVPVFAARWAVPHPAVQQHACEAVVSALCQAVKIKDSYTRGHCERVSRASVMIAMEIGMPAGRVAAIRYAGMLHDVGKLCVLTSMLQKSGSLTDDEYAAIQLHPMYGLDIVREIGVLDEALPGIVHHHERIDGTGYPLGLAGNEIPEFARLLAVADAFDAMTSNRSYRGARSVPEAVAELRRWAGTQFDPAFVGAFVSAIERDGWTVPDPP
jgi:hypothetical protein